MRTAAAIFTLMAVAGCGRVAALIFDEIEPKAERPTVVQPETPVHAEPVGVEPKVVGTSDPQKPLAKRPSSDPDDLPAPFGRAADAIAPLDPNGVVFELYPAVEEGTDPYAGQKPPEGVSIGSARRGGGQPYPVVHIRRVSDETLAQTVARVRPWFDALRLPEGRKFVFEIVRPAAENEDVEVALVEDRPIAILGSDVKWIGTQAGRTGGPELRWSESGRARLPALTADLADDVRAIVVADRMLWMPTFGRALGVDDMKWSIGFVRDPTLAAAIRDAMAGKPEAIAALRDDRVVDGGRADQVEDARLALLPPAPTRDADGRTRVAVEPFEGTIRHASVVLGDAWVLEHRDEASVRWKRGEIDAQWMLTVELGCDGSCEAAKLDAQIEQRIGELASKESSANVAGYLEKEGVAETRVVAIDGREGGARIWVLARRYEPAPKIRVPPGVEAHCWAHDADDDHFARIELQAPWTAEAEAIAAFKTMCASLRTE